MRFYHWNTAFPAAIPLSYQNRPLPEFLSQVLVSRGIDNDSGTRCFLDCDEPLNDPMLLKDMDKAVAILEKALDENRKILIFGDYDCDGITATVMLYDYLDNMGADVCYYIPERLSEGYGLNIDTIKMIKQSGIELLITVDNGISSVKEINFAKELGIEVIVTDHHSLPETLPAADAVIDPLRPESAYPFRQLCGAGVAFKLMCAFEQAHQGEEAQDFLMDEYGDLLTIATLADIVPLVGENRLLTRRGMQVLRNTQRPGLLALAEASKLDISSCTSENVAFVLAPRINVTGRIGSVDKAVELLLSSDEQQSLKLAKEINELNNQRREMEASISGDIVALLRKKPSLIYQRVLTVVGSDWHLGVIGISASRMVEQFRKPCVVISCDDGMARGSARSVEGFSIIAAISACSEKLIKFGGHPMAAGFSLREEDVPAFIDEIDNYCRENYPAMPAQTLKVDARLPLAEITLQNAELLSQLAPFGCANPQPVFLLSDVSIAAVSPIGNGQHLRIIVQSGGISAPLVYFGVAATEFPFCIGDRVDIACSLSINVYNDQRRVSVRVLNLHPAEYDDKGAGRDSADFDALMRGEVPSDELPRFTREDLALLFRFLRDHSPYCRGSDALHFELCRKAPGLRLFTVQVGLCILRELGLISIDDSGDVSILPAQQKVALENSVTYSRLLS